MSIFSRKTSYESLIQTINNFSKQCSDIMVDILCLNNIPFEHINRYYSDLFFYIYNRSAFTQNFMILFGDKKADKFANHYTGILSYQLSNHLSENDKKEFTGLMEHIEGLIFKAVYDNHIVTETDHPALRLANLYFNLCTGRTLDDKYLRQQIVDELEHIHRMRNDISYNTKL